MYLICPIITISMLYYQSWALAIYFQVRSPLISFPWIAIALALIWPIFRFAHRSIALKKPVVRSRKRALKRKIVKRSTFFPSTFMAVVKKSLTISFSNNFISLLSSVAEHQSCKYLAMLTSGHEFNSHRRQVGNVNKERAMMREQLIMGLGICVDEFNFQLVRMAERSKALRSGRSPLLWARVRSPLLTTICIIFLLSRFCHFQSQNKYRRILNTDVISIL